MGPDVGTKIDSYSVLLLSEMALHAMQGISRNILDNTFDLKFDF